MALVYYMYMEYIIKILIACSHNFSHPCCALITSESIVSPNPHVEKGIDLGSTLYMEMVPGSTNSNMHIVANDSGIKFYIFGPIRRNIKY